MQITMKKKHIPQGSWFQWFVNSLSGMLLNLPCPTAKNEQIKSYFRECNHKEMAGRFPSEPNESVSSHFGTFLLKIYIFYMWL